MMKSIYLDNYQQKALFETLDTLTMSATKTDDMYATETVYLTSQDLFNLLQVKQKLRNQVKPLK